MKIKLLRASVFCCVALSSTYVAGADRSIHTDVTLAEDNAALSLRPNIRSSKKYDINCGEGNDPCGEGSACAGIRIAFLNLCEGSHFFMADECSFLLSKLQSEAQKQNIEFNCVYYLRHKLLDNFEEKRHDELSTYSCPTEEGWTKDLKSGQTETVSCAHLYPSGIFNGFLHRYCMLGGGNLIHDDCRIVQNETLPMDDLGMNMMKLPRSTLSNQLGNNKNKIFDGAKKSSEILNSVGNVLEAANEAGLIAEKLGKIIPKLGVALKAIGVAFSIVNIFLPKQDSAELIYMKEQFKIVKSKLDAITDQMDSVEHKLTFAIIKDTFLQYKATLDVCGFRLKGFQSNPTEGSKKSFLNQCCESDTSPITFLHWMGANIPKYSDKAMKATGYDMGQFLTEAQGIIYSTATASYLSSTCSGLIYEGETVNTQIQKVEGLSKKVLFSIQQSITKLPSKYIDTQLVSDVNKVVRETHDTDSCAKRLHSVVYAKIKAWKTKPRVSAYCYGKAHGWNENAYSWYRAREDVGGYFALRLRNKFSVGVDWTNSPMNLDMNYINAELRKQINSRQHFSRTKGDSGITMLRSALNNLLLGHNRKVRNVAYIKHGFSCYVYSFSDREYILDFQGFRIVFSVWPKSGKCVDKQQNCAYWARKGYCTKYVSYMAANCKDSCQTDSNLDCSYWKGLGFCTGEYEAYMTLNCKMSCDVC